MVIMSNPQQEYIFDPIKNTNVKLPDGTICRLGNESDQDSILELSIVSNSMDGWDYLPGMWKEWVNDPRFIMVVAEKDGKVVAFTGTRLTNNGRHMIGFGARAHKDYREEGIFKACFNWKTDYVTKYAKFVEKRLGVVGGANVQLQLDWRAKGQRNFDDVYHGKWIFLGLCVPIDDFRTAITKLNTAGDDLKEVKTPEELKSMFSDYATVYDLFPTRHIVLHQDGHEILPETVNDIWHPRRKIFVSKKQDRYNTLSFGTAFPCTVGTGYNIECYGDMSPEMQLLHIKHHVNEMFEYHNKFGGKLCIVLSVPQMYDIESTFKLFRGKLNLCDDGIGLRESMGMAFDIPSKL